MATFYPTETVICSIEVKDAAGNYVDPATSMKITIRDPATTTLVNGANMTKDAVGKYHYDYILSANALPNKYTVIYIATDTTRVSMTKDYFTVAQ